MRCAPWVVLFSSSFSLLSGCHTCDVGSESCPCTPGGGCDQGLVCLSKHCVDPTGGVGGGHGGGGGGSGGGGDAGWTLLPDGGMKPPPPPSCTKNGDCQSDELCTFDPGGGSACIKGSQKACGTGPCINGMAYNPHTTGMETTLRGLTCSTTADCPLVKGNIYGVCVDQDGTGANRTCVPLCQYNDDQTVLSCATDPRFALSTDCSRNHARIWAMAGVLFWCGSQRISNVVCLPPPNPVFDGGTEYTVSCFENYLELGVSDCQTFEFGCFYDPPNNNAPQGIGDAFADVRATVAFQQTPVSGSGGGSGSTNDQCSADCDCGHCSYCDSSGSGHVCRYAGEGPYGCYRGCD